MSMNSFSIIRDGNPSHENKSLEEQANTVGAYLNALQNQASRLRSQHQNNHSVPYSYSNTANQQNIPSINLSTPLFPVGDSPHTHAHAHAHAHTQPNPSGGFLAPFLSRQYQQQQASGSNPFLLPQIVNPSSLINDLLLHHEPPSTTASLPVATPSVSEAKNKPDSTDDPNPLAHPPVVPPNTPFFSSILYIEQQDDECLSKYQCLVRKQIEVFEATESDLTEKSQGRNTPIILRQVGIRCMYCGKLNTTERGKGAKYFPTQLDGLYQTAQNLASKHFLQQCKEIPASKREDLARLRAINDTGAQSRKSVHGLGRRYWSECLRTQGVVAIDRRLFLLRENDCKNNASLSSGTATESSSSTKRA